MQVDALRVHSLNLLQHYAIVYTHSSNIRNHPNTTRLAGAIAKWGRGHGRVSVEHTIPVSVWHSVANVIREGLTTLGSANSTFQGKSWITGKSPINNSIVLWSGANVSCEGVKQGWTETYRRCTVHTGLQEYWQCARRGKHRRYITWLNWFNLCLIQNKIW